jgi:hypothetical protein
LTNQVGLNLIILIKKKSGAMQATKQIDAAAHIILIKARKTFSSEQYLIACLRFNNILKKVNFFLKLKYF